MVRAMVLDEGRPVALTVRVARHMDMGTQHHHVGDLEALQQQRQQAQIRGQHIDRERRVGVRPAAQPDIVEGDIAGGKYRNFGIALDHEVEPGHGADLRLHRLAQRIPFKSQDVANRPISATPRNAAIGIPRRFIPWAIVKELSWLGRRRVGAGGSLLKERAGVREPMANGRNLIGFLDAFKASGWVYAPLPLAGEVAALRSAIALRCAAVGEVYPPH